MFNDEKNQNIYRDNKIIIRIVLFLVFIVAPLTLSGCDDISCGNFDNNTITISVNGEGYFMVRSFDENDAVYFTKSNSFSVNQDNLLVNSQCYVLQGFSLDDNGWLRGAITDIWLQEQILIEDISSEGVISVRLVDGTVFPVSRIALAGFVDPENLQDESNGIYSSTEESGPPINGVPGSNIFIDMLFGTIESEIF